MTHLVREVFLFDIRYLALRIRKLSRFYQKRDAGNASLEFRRNNPFAEISRVISRVNTIVHDDDSHRISSLTQISPSPLRVIAFVGRGVGKLSEPRNLHLALRASDRPISLPRVRRYARIARLVRATHVARAGDAERQRTPPGTENLTPREVVSH